MGALQDLTRGLKNRNKRKKDDSTNYRPPTTEKLKKCIADALTSKIKDARKLPLVQFLLENNRHEKKGWIRTFIPTSSFPNKFLSKEERKILFYIRTVFKTASIQRSALEHAFGVSGHTIVSIANGYFDFFDSDPSMPPVLRDEKDSRRENPTHVSHQSTPPLLAQATKRARTGPTPPVQIFCEDNKKGEEKIEIQLESKDSTTSVTDTPSPRDPDDDNEFTFRAPTFLFSTPPPRVNVAFDETPAATVQRRCVFLKRIILSAKKSANHNVSSVGRLLQSAKKAASRNASALLRSAPKASQRNNGTFDQKIGEGIELLASKVVSKGVIREDVMGLAVAVLGMAAKEETDPTHPFQVRYKPLDSKNRRTKVYAEVPIPTSPARKNTTEESRKRRTRDRSARLHAYVECLCGEDVAKQQAAVTGLVENRMGGFLHWSELLLDVEDCIVVRERTGGLSTTKLVTTLDTISKILGKRIYPAQLMKKISKVEWGLLQVKHRLVEVQVEDAKMAHCVFYWVPNLPLLQEMLIASAIIEGKCEDSLTLSKYVNAHILGRGID
jgi:hypothetical protein